MKKKSISSKSIWRANFSVGRRRGFLCAGARVGYCRSL